MQTMRPGSPSESCRTVVEANMFDAIDPHRVEWRAFDQVQVPPILHSALGCFVEQGYHGTTTRVLAAAAGLSIAGLYHHYPSKQAMLVALMEFAMEDLWARSSAAYEEAGESVASQLQLHIECLVLFHAHRGQLAFIASSEIRSLESDARTRYIATRDRQEELLQRVVSRGVEEGVFSTAYPRERTRALITMCTGVAQWFRPGGTLSAEELAAEYAAVADDILTTRAKPLRRPRSR